VLREGSRVSYVGPPSDRLAMGDQGRLLSVSGSVGHVMWESGACQGQTSAHYDIDLATTGSQGVQASIEDSLEVGGLVTFAVRDAYDTGGEVGVLNALAESGHLASFGDIAEEALTLVSTRIRRDASFQAVLADLDPEEAEGVLRLASACLIRDAFTSED
jgi:hypothetical protein